jgi:hypothetical protein
MPSPGPLSRRRRLASRREFGMRILRHGGAMIALLVVGLGIGVCGYRFWGGLSWLDALVNAAMILGGMGPVDPIASVAGKLFASAYALFSGVLLLSSVGILLTPIAHRLLHRLHLEDQGDDEAAN